MTTIPDPRPGVSLGVTPSLLTAPLLVLAAIVAFVEATDRLPRVDEVVPQTWTRRIPEFDLKYRAYRRSSREEGPFDVVVIGSSLAAEGVRPDALENGVRRRLKRRLRAFNFGVSGAPNEVVIALIRILRKDPCPPRLLLYVTSDVTLSKAGGERLEGVVEEEPWFRYRAGERDVEGWLLDRWSGLRRWNALSRGQAGWRAESQIGPTGDRQFPLRRRPGAGPKGGGAALDEPPLMDDVPPWPPSVDLLRALLEEIGPGRGVVAIVPVRPTPVRRSLPLHAAAMAEAAHDAGLPLVLSPPEELLPDDVYQDAGHLGIGGARIYSRWLGERLAELAETGSIDLPAAGSP